MTQTSFMHQTDNIFEDPEEAQDNLRQRSTLKYRLANFWKQLENWYWDFQAKYVEKYWRIDCRHDFGSYTRYDGAYADPSALMLFAAFAILVKFVEKEMYQSYVDWDSECSQFTMKSSKNEIMALYNWWTKERHEEWKNIYEDMDIVDNEEGPAFKFGKADPVTGTSQMKFNHSERRNSIWKRMDAAERRDQEMLKRLIDIREVLWT